MMHNDFEALLSRDYRPARGARLVPNEAYRPPTPPPPPAATSQAGHTSDNSKQQNSNNASAATVVTDSSSSSTSGTNSNNNNNNDPNNNNNDDAEKATTKNGGDVNGNEKDENAAAAAAATTAAAAAADVKAREVDEETSRLVLSLVSQTPAFTQHLPVDGDQDTTAGSAAALAAERLLTKHKPAAANALANDGNDSSAAAENAALPTAFHEVQLGDWESQIDWEGYGGDKQRQAQLNNTNNSSSAVPAAPSTGGAATAAATSGAADNDVDHERNAIALLKRPRNPYLDNITFDIDWDGTAAAKGDDAEVPLILEWGVAGRSVARHVYQNTVLSAQRPPPASQSAAYRRRVERDWSNAQEVVSSTADATASGSLHADKAKMERLIKAKQKQREEMAKNKTKRVLEAMGTMGWMEGGKGRTITSSLMGPGGTERTGRPSRGHLGATAAHESEYVEQLDMVANHSIVRDMSKVMLRQYHRPKLPLRVVRLDLSWQFQIRYAPSGKKSGEPGVSTSYQAIMVGTHAGAISKSKLVSETTLSPAEGELVVLEYSEERPPIQLTKGMCSKIVNYYRGDKARCPVSAGGGDRPARRKRTGETSGTAAKELAIPGKPERLPKLEGPNKPTTVTDWIGKLPKKTKKDQSEKESFDILPEGVTEILHPKVHGPFLGEITADQTVSGLISNLFVAPIFRQEPESTDFLMVLCPPGGMSQPGQRDSMRVILRDFPTSLFTVGQTEPRTRVYAPNTQGEKNFVGPWISYQIARALTRAQVREGHGLRFDELQGSVLPNLEIAAPTLRQRLKQVALYDRESQIWTTKSIGYEDYPGCDALGKSISPEGVAAFETSCSATRRLSDLGLYQLFSGSHTVASLGVAWIYLKGQLNAARELARKAKKRADWSRTKTSNAQPMQVAFYERSAAELDATYKMLRQRLKVAEYIYEELQLAPWHLTGEFIDVHKKGEGSGMMKLTGLGDPSGQGDGFSFLRQADSKPSKSAGNAALNAQVKKITGTEDDLRKLTMKQMGAILRSYGMSQKYIDTLKRWDRVHVIRDASTKQASDGQADGLGRFARGEKLKLADQKQKYRGRIQVIWRRQIAALSASSDPGDRVAGGDGGGSLVDGAETGTDAAKSKKSDDGDDDDSSDGDSDDDDSDDDELVNSMEEMMMDRSETNQMIAAHAGGKDGEGGLGNLRAAAQAAQDQDLSKDARELAALKRQREEERAAQEGMRAMRTGDDSRFPMTGGLNGKVIRKRVTKTYPDGRQTTTFKFVLQPEEVSRTRARLELKKDEKPQKRELNYEYGSEEKPPGQALFEDEDVFEYSTKKGRIQAKQRRGGNRRGRTPTGGRARGMNLQIGKLKTKVSKAERVKKRKREEEELEVYTAPAKRKGTSNRRERGSIRERRPHVIFAEKLESIRAQVEARPMNLVGPFLKPVSRRLLPRYYELITHPIDLSTIKERISSYNYRTADAFVKDFELMKSNAIKFNGESSHIAQEAVHEYEFVRDQVNSFRDELSKLEEDVKEQMSGKPKKKKKQGGSKKASATDTVASVGGVSVNLGDLSQHMPDGNDSDSDESYAELGLDIDGV